MADDTAAAHSSNDDAHTASTTSLLVLDTLTELTSTGYTHHVPLLANKPNNYHNVQKTPPKIYEGVELTDRDGECTATLTKAAACLQAWLGANDTTCLTTAMQRRDQASPFTHEQCNLRVVAPPSTLTLAPGPPTEAIDLCTLQHMIDQLHPQLETTDDQCVDERVARPLFNTMHTVRAPTDTVAVVQPLGAPVVLPTHCRFLMSDIRRVHMLVAGACLPQSSSSSSSTSSQMPQPTAITTSSSSTPPGKTRRPTVPRPTPPFPTATSCSCPSSSSQRPTPSSRCGPPPVQSCAG